MDLPEIARFYQYADEADLAAFERALDRDDVEAAEAVLDRHKEAARVPGYLDYPPQEGDLCYLVTTGRYVHLVALSDDGTEAVVVENAGPYVVKYEDLRRTR